MNIKNENERVIPILNETHSNNVYAYTILPKLLDKISEKRKE